jgi:outer membrane protein TolC
MPLLTKLKNPFQKVIKMKFTVFMLLAWSWGASALDMQNFVKRLQAQHPFFTQQNLSQEIQTLDLQSAESTQDWIFSAGLNYINEDASDITSTYTNLNTSALTLSASKKILDSGAKLVLQHSFTQNSGDSNQARSKFSIDYVHPLLKNNSGINDKLGIDLAHLNLKINALDLLEKKEVFLQEKLKKFIDLTYAQQQASINAQRLKLSAIELKLMEEKFKSSVADKLDLLLQQSAYQAAKQRDILAKQELNILATEMAFMLKVPNVVADVDLYKIQMLESISHWLNSSRVLKILNLRNSILSRQLKSANNQKNATLDLTLGLSTQGEKSNYANATHNQSPTWRIGLDYQLPLGQRAANASAGKYLLELANLEAQKAEKILDLSIAFKVNQKNMSSLKALLFSNKLQLEAAIAQTQEQKIEYDNGNAPMRF